MENLVGRVAVVTGGSGWIGSATVRALAARGCVVVAADLDEARGDQVVRHVVDGGGRAVFARLNVASESEWAGLVTRVLGDYGSLDILVNLAGILSTEDVEHETQEMMEHFIAVNQMGCWLGMKHCIPVMRSRGHGAVINVASICGVVGGLGRAVAYHMTKASIRGLTRNAAVRYARDGIRVNSVHPGQIETPMTLKDRGTEYEAKMLDMTPMGRLGQPDEVANVIAFLASDDASFMTGAEVFVDGGWTAQ